MRYAKGMTSQVSALSDEEIAHRVQEGNTEDFGMLMDRYVHKLSRYGRKFLSNDDHIEDMVQEIFIKAYEHIQSFDSNQKFSPWIYRIAHNTYANELRRKSRIPVSFFDFDVLVSYAVDTNTPEHEQERQEMKKIVDQGLEQLPSRYREIVILYYIDDFGYKEISDILHIPIGTVGVRLRRAKESLKEIYKKLHINHEY